MIYNISGEQPFQVLSDSFSVSPSQSGYDLYLSADGFNYSRFATVASGTTKQFTGMNNGNYYILSGNTSEVKANWERDCGGGGGAAGVSSLDGQTGALTTKTIGGQSILGEGDIPAGGVAQYDLDAMSQAERAEFVAMCENLTDEERRFLFVYRDGVICTFDHTEGSGNSFKIGFFDTKNDGWNYTTTKYRHFFVKADGSYEASGYAVFPEIVTFDTAYSDTAHTLSSTDGFSPLIPVSNLNAESEGKVAINLRLIIQNSPTKIVLSSKAWSERTGNLEGKIGAEWHYSGNVITAVWNVVEHTATIASWTEVPEGGSAGGSNVYYVDGDSINSYSGIVDEIYHKLSSGETAYATVKYDYAKYPVAKAEIYEYQEGQPGDPDYLRQEGFQIIAARFGSDGYAIRSGIVRAFRYEGRDGNGYSCGQSWDYAMPEVSGGDYMIVEDLSAITSPTDGMIAYVPAHQETYSGLSIESSQIAYQAKLRKTAPREIDYNFSGAHNFDTNNPNSAPYDFDSDEQGNWHSIWDESVWLRYDSGQSRTYCVAKSGFTVICYLSSDYYEEITTAVTISPKTYIYRNGSWLRYEDGLVSFRLDTYATMDEWNTFISAITEFNAGEYQYVADEYYYGWSTHRFKTREKYDTNMSNGFGFAFECKASNAETFDNLQALNIKISNGSGWRAYDVAKYDFLNPPTNG